MTEKKEVTTSLGELERYNQLFYQLDMHTDFKADVHGVTISRDSKTNELVAREEVTGRESQELLRISL